MNTNICYSNNIRILFEYRIIRSPLTPPYGQPDRKISVFYALPYPGCETKFAEWFISISQPLDFRFRFPGLPFFRKHGSYKEENIAMLEVGILNWKTPNSTLMSLKLLLRHNFKFWFDILKLIIHNQSLLCRSLDICGKSWF